ncbi:MAG: hypothetical protein M3Y72_05000 [Acidobacteriota bacterium]|nr:hypothetical protein [Acidobacteriota bacterium]
MTLEKIRKKVRELHSKTRRQLLGTLAGPLVATFFFVFSVKRFPSLQYVLQPLFAFALVWSFAGLYFLNQGKWSAGVPQVAGFSAGLEFCRQEIERQRDYFHRILLWQLGPLLLAIGTFILALAIVAGRKTFLNAIPFMTLVVAWIAAYFVIRVRQQRELQCEIDELNDIERENSR